MAFEPNTTPTPNWLYNGEMRKMNETELKVVLLVTRKTLGWFDPMTGNQRKEQDYISQSQFIQFTGKSNRAIATAIQSCIEKGWIIAREKKGILCDTPLKRARRKIWYQLGSIFTKNLSGEESSQDKIDKSGEHFSKSGEHNDINLVKKVHSTKETITKEKNTAETSSAPPFNSSKRIKEDYPMSLPEFAGWCKKSPQRHIQIIGEWAVVVEPNYTTRGQWQSFIKRNLRVANNLTPFTEKQLQEAFEKLENDIQRIDKNTGKKVGFITKFTLETLFKYV